MHYKRFHFSVKQFFERFLHYSNVFAVIFPDFLHFLHYFERFDKLLLYQHDGHPSSGQLLHAVTYKTVPLFRDLPQLFHDPAAQGIDIHRFLDIQQFKYFINICRSAHQIFPV